MGRSTKDVTGAKRTIAYEELHHNTTGKSQDVTVTYTRLIPDGSSVYVQVSKNEPTTDAKATRLDRSGQKTDPALTVPDGERIWARLEPKLVPNKLQLDWP